MSTKKVTMTCGTPDTIIKYTLDGTDPTEASTEYIEQIEVTPPVTIKARGYKEGLLTSDVTSYEVEAPAVPVTVPMALPDGSVLFYDRGTSYGEYKINDSGYPERVDGAVDDGSAESQNWRYLICDQADLEGKEEVGPSGTKEKWGPHGTREGLTDTAIGVGLPNTDVMFPRYAHIDSYWWKLINEKRDSTGLDWFMPSKDELDMLYDNRDVISLEGGVALRQSSYWSSSEYDSASAWYQSLSTGTQKYNYKNTMCYCRLLRRI